MVDIAAAEREIAHLRASASSGPPSIAAGALSIPTAHPAGEPAGEVDGDRAGPRRCRAAGRWGATGQQVAGGVLGRAPPVGPQHRVVVAVGIDIPRAVGIGSSSACRASALNQDLSVVPGRVKRADEAERKRTSEWMCCMWTVRPVCGPRAGLRRLCDHGAVGRARPRGRPRPGRAGGAVALADSGLVPPLRLVPGARRGRGVQAPFDWQDYAWSEPNQVCQLPERDLMCSRLSVVTDGNILVRGCLR